MMQPQIIKISSVFNILRKIPMGDPQFNLYPCKTLTIQNGRGISWVRVWVDVWTPAGTPLLITTHFGKPTGFPIPMPNPRWFLVLAQIQCQIPQIPLPLLADLQMEAFIQHRGQILWGFLRDIFLDRKPFADEFLSTALEFVVLLLKVTQVVIWVSFVTYFPFLLTLFEFLSLGFHSNLLGSLENICEGEQYYIITDLFFFSII